MSKVGVARDGYGNFHVRVARACPVPVISTVGCPNANLQHPPGEQVDLVSSSAVHFLLVPPAVRMAELRRGVRKLRRECGLV